MEITIHLLLSLRLHGKIWSAQKSTNIDIWLNKEQINMILDLATPYGMGISQWKRNDHR